MRKLSLITLEGLLIGAITVPAMGVVTILTWIAVGWLWMAASTWII